MKVVVLLLVRLINDLRQPIASIHRCSLTAFGVDQIFGQLQHQFLNSRSLIGDMVMGERREKAKKGLRRWMVERNESHRG